MRYERAVPIASTGYHSGRKARWQRAARHHVLRPERPILIVEVDRVAGACVDGTHAEAYGTLPIEEIKINKLLQTLSERRGVVDAKRLRGALRNEEGRRDARDEETRDTEGCCRCGARSEE